LHYFLAAVTQQNSDTVSILHGLNSEQTDAVLLPEGPFLVLAGAGSGKTRVLIHRVLYLIQEKKVDPSSILAVTFTNKAAKEMKARLEKMISKKSADQVWIGTFHGICNRLLRGEIGNVILDESKPDSVKWTRNFVIYDPSECLAVLKESIKSLNLDDKVYPPKGIQHQISALKNRAQSASDFSKVVKDGFELRLSEIYNKYQERLLANNALDFDDLLLFVLKLFKNNPGRRKAYYERFKHVLVDEFQDTNQTQYELLKLLAIDPSSPTERDWTDRSFCAVGDIDQSIYSWRGANYKLTLNLQKDFPEASLIKLEYNYRSSDPILEVANSVIKNNKQRIEKKLLGTKGQGEKINCFEAADEMEEGYYIASEIARARNKGVKLGKIAVLYRTNAQSRAIEEALIKGQVPYKIVGGVRFYDRLEIKDIVAYLRLIYNAKDSSALKRVINTPRRGIGPSAITQIEEKANSLGMSLYDALSDLLDSGTFSPKVTQAAHGFINLIDSLIEDAKTKCVPDLLRLTIERSGYLNALKEVDTEESEGRIENIHELVSVAEQFHEESEDNSLEAFLAQISLVGELDDLKGEDTDAVTLLTIHSSKGLEFPFVFLSGLEEGIFPHNRALGDTNNAADELEEERRLLYVAVTRAEDRLFLTYARRRRLWGQREYAEPSRFLAEMPQELITGYWGSSVQQSKKPVGASSFSSKHSYNVNQEEQVSKVAQPAVPEPPKFKIGDRVKHKTFGVGKVLNVFGAKSQRFYSIEFDNADGKKLLSGDSLSAV
jgi:DNA helicase II / ATP-dependent DNA helicase PcrA